MGVDENKNKLIPWVDDNNQQRQLDSNPRSLFNQNLYSLNSKGKQENS